MTATAAFSATRSGRRVDLLSPEKRLIRALDLADGLAKINRWAGATLAPFCVAQHCGYVADLMDREAGPRAALYGLLHDGHEYVIGDVLESTSLALEITCPGYPRALRMLRWRVDNAIHRAFHLEWPRPPEIERLLDLCHVRVVATEVRDVLDPSLKPSDFALPIDARPLTFEIVPVTWGRAASAFAESIIRYQVCAGINPLEE